MNRALISSLLLFVALGIAWADDDKRDSPEDLSSPEAKALAAKLHVPPRWRASDGSVDLLYSFFEDGEEKDWKITGADLLQRAEGKAASPKGGKRGRGASGGEPAGLKVSVNAGTALLVLEAVELKGDFTLETTLMVEQQGPSSDLVFLCGLKGKDGVGARFGDQLVKLGAKGFTPLTKNAPSAAKFTPKDSVEVKLIRKGDELRTTINGADGQTRTFAEKELDGKVGLLLAKGTRIVIARFRVTGAIDRSKL
jgi:hypothetical protein